MITDEVLSKAASLIISRDTAGTSTFLIVMILLELVDRVIYSSRMVAQGQLWVP